MESLASNSSPNRTVRRHLASALLRDGSMLEQVLRQTNYKSANVTGECTHSVIRSVCKPETYTAAAAGALVQVYIQL